VILAVTGSAGAESDERGRLALVTGFTQTRIAGVARARPCVFTDSSYDFTCAETSTAMPAGGAFRAAEA